MAIALVTSVTAGPGSAGGATSAIDTTGATLLVISASWWGLPCPTVAFSDNKGNTWTLVTLQGAVVGNDMRQQFAYCLSPTVGTGHTFSVTGASAYPAIIVFAFSGTAGYSYQTRSGAGGSVASPFATGSVTPTANNALILTGYVVNNGTLPTGLTVSTAGFALTTKQGVGSTCFPGGAAYLVQTPAAAINPTWSWTSGTFETAVSTAVFVGAAAATEGRVSQDAIETLSQPILPATRVTQDAIETLSLPFPPARVTQAVVETLSATVSSGVSGTGDVTLSHPLLDGTGTTTAPSGSGDVTISHPLVDGTGTAALPSSTGTGDVTLSHPLLSGAGVVPPFVRVTQALTELLTQSPPIATRATQEAVETFQTQTATTRTTQVAIEVFHPIIVPTRTTQLPVEYFDARTAALRTSQEAVEVFLILPPCISGDFPVDTVTGGSACASRLPYD